MSDINLNDTYANINQAITNGLAVGAVTGVPKSDGANGFTTATAPDVGAASASHVTDLVTDIEGVHGLIIESGTWTPALEGGTTTGTPTYTARDGIYKRIGNMVYFTLKVDFSAQGGMDGQIFVTGFPFLAASVQNLGYITIIPDTTWNPAYAYITSNYSGLGAIKTGTAYTASDLPSSGEIALEGSYTI